MPSDVCPFPFPYFANETVLCNIKQLFYSHTHTHVCTCAHVCMSDIRVLTLPLKSAAIPGCIYSIKGNYAPVWRQLPEGDSIIWYRDMSHCWNAFEFVLKVASKLQLSPSTEKARNLTWHSTRYWLHLNLSNGFYTVISNRLKMASCSFTNFPTCRKNHRGSDSKYVCMRLICNDFGFSFSNAVQLSVFVSTWPYKDSNIFICIWIIIILYIIYYIFIFIIYILYININNYLSVF